MELRFESRKEDELRKDAPPRLEARCETGGELLERYDERLRGVLRCELLLKLERMPPLFGPRGIGEAPRREAGLLLRRRGVECGLWLRWLRPPLRLLLRKERLVGGA